MTDDPVVMQANVDSLKLQLQLKDKDVLNYIDKYKTLKEQNIGLIHEVRRLEGQEKVYESTTRALKDQLAFIKDKCRDVGRLNSEVNRLKEQLRKMDRLKTVLDGTREQVEDMLRENIDQSSMSLLVVTLKKELSDTDRRKRSLSDNLKKVQSELSVLKTELERAQLVKKEYQHFAEQHKDCVNEKYYLKQKISELHRSISDIEILSGQSTVSEKSVNRTLAESPAPCSFRTYQSSKSPMSSPIKFKSPTIADKVKIIQASDSPYLPIQSSGVGTYTLNRPTFIPSNSSSNEYSIFKQSHSSVDRHNSGKHSHSEYSYDGLGGHSKEERFPSGNRSVGIGLKRPKPSSFSLPAKKFKKLAPSSTSTKAYSSRQD